MLFQLGLAKLIVDNGLDDLWRRENPDYSELTHYHRYSGIRCRIDRVCTDIKIFSNTKINHVMVSFTDHYNAISIDKIYKLKLKLKKIHENLKLKN